MNTSPHRRSASGLETLVDLAEVLDQDESTLRTERRHRDRAIGRDLAGLAGQPARQLAAWLSHPDAPHAGEAGRTVSRVHRLTVLLLTMLGLLTGMGAAAAVFHYDGENPVNVIHVLAVFVVLQLVLVLLTLLTMLPRSALRWIPGAPSMQETLSLLSPGRLRGALVRRLPEPIREALDGAQSRGMAHRALFGGVDKWAISHSAQWGALGFQLGALAGCLYLVVFSDLAFSWNTTLQVEPAGLHRLTSALATPWAGWLPDADPPLELIESTRHFRLKSGVFPGLEASPADGPSALGGWWPFLVACMTAYGFLPRLVTLLVATSRLRSATRQALVHLPGARELLDRINGQLVETAGDEPDTEGSDPDAAPPPMPAGETWPTATGIRLVNWAGVDVPAEQFGPWFSATVRSVHPAGGSRTLEEDHAVMEELAGKSDPDPVAILVRAWEPPMAEFVDFVAGLRKAMGPARTITVVPAGVGSDHRPLPRELAMWQRRLEKLGDPWLRVAAREDAP